MRAKHGLRRLALLAALLPLTLAGPATAAYGDPAGRSSSPVITIPPPSPSVVGSSQLVRTGNGVSATLKTSGLEPGHVVTLWWIVANNPAECEAGLPGLSRCGPRDHIEGRGNMSVLNAAGRIVGEDGTANYGAHLRVGDTSRALFDGEPGLTDSHTAEVILVVKTHGPKIPELTSEMLSTFAGGCEDQTTPLPTVRPEMVGTAGPNDCAEIQLSVHSPA